MSAKSGIAWTDATWNPVVGCTKVSDGCKNCYAETLHNLRYKAFHQGKKIPVQYEQPFRSVQLLRERLEMPLHWKKPRKIFVNSMSDLFHPSVPFDFIDEVFFAMERASWHTFQILTKRATRMAEYYQERNNWLFDMPNIWLGVSVENQAAANERIPYLLRTPAKIRFLSCEPLLGPIDLGRVVDQHLVGRIDLGHVVADNPFIYNALGWDRFTRDNSGKVIPVKRGIDWVICGGESGKNARAMNPMWVRDLRDQCKVAGMPFFFKQWGEYAPVEDMVKRGMKSFKEPPVHVDFDTSMARVGVAMAGHELDGEVWQQMPR